MAKGQSIGNKKKMHANDILFYFIFAGQGGVQDNRSSI